MKKNPGKALYLFLCALLGIMLFGVFHRALVVIYYLLQDGAYFHMPFSIGSADLQALDFFTMLIALFLGGWYGVWIGLHWYELVYEGEHRAGLFHGFLPHYFRKEERANRRKAGAVEPKAVHVPVTEQRPTFEKITNLGSSMPWDIDDIGSERMTKKPVRKKVVRKTVKRVRKVESV